MQFPILQDLGLGEREAQVYETLLRLGDCPIADLLQALQIHPQLIYRAIDALVAKGLVIVSYRRHRKYVRAEDPHILEKQETERLAALKKALPDMLALQQGSKDAIIRVEKGLEAVRKARASIIELLPEKGSFAVIGGSGEHFYRIMGEQLREIERKRIKRGITRQILSFQGQRESIEGNDPFKSLTEYRYIDLDYPTPMSTLVYGKYVTLLIYTADPIVINMESQEVADGYQAWFEALWKVARP